MVCKVKGTTEGLIEYLNEKEKKLNNNIMKLDYLNEIKEEILTLIKHGFLDQEKELLLKMLRVIDFVENNKIDESNTFSFKISGEDLLKTIMKTKICYEYRRPYERESKLREIKILKDFGVDVLIEIDNQLILKVYKEELTFVNE